MSGCCCHALPLIATLRYAPLHCTCPRGTSRLAPASKVLLSVLQDRPAVTVSALLVVAEVVGKVDVLEMMKEVKVWRVLY